MDSPNLAVAIEQVLLSHVFSCSRYPGTLDTMPPNRLLVGPLSILIARVGRSSQVLQQARRLLQVHDDCDAILAIGALPLPTFGPALLAEKHLYHLSLFPHLDNHHTRPSHASIA